MTQQFEVRTSSTDALDLAGFEHVRDPEGPVEETNPMRTEWTFSVADTEPKADVIAELKAQLTGADWTTVEYRHALAEYREPEYCDDETYYHPVHGLRTPVSIEWLEGFTVAVEAAYVLDGTEYSIDTEATIAPAEDAFSRTDTLVGTAEGLEHNGAGVPLGRVTVKEPIDRIPRSGITVEDYPNGRDEAETVLEIGEEPESQPLRERIYALESATGAAGDSKRGIAHRIDDLDDRISALEDAQ